MVKEINFAEEFSLVRNSPKTCALRLNPNLFVFEAGSDVSQLLVDPEPFLLFVLTIADITDKDGETSHPRQRHLYLDPAGESNPLRLWNPRSQAKMGREMDPRQWVIAWILKKISSISRTGIHKEISIREMGQTMLDLERERVQKEGEGGLKKIEKAVGQCWDDLYLPLPISIISIFHLILLKSYSLLSLFF